MGGGEPIWYHDSKFNNNAAIKDMLLQQLKVSRKERLMVMGNVERTSQSALSAECMVMAQALSVEYHSESYSQQYQHIRWLLG